MFFLNLGRPGATIALPQIFCSKMNKIVPGRPRMTFSVAFRLKGTTEGLGYQHQGSKSSPAGNMPFRGTKIPVFSGDQKY